MTRHERMLREIEAEARLTGDLTGRPAFASRVIDAMAKVPRHEFVPPEQAPFAYENAPLPIGHGQTISQPFIVALMTELLDLEAGSIVLEIGTGCGYQAAVLAELAGEVYSIEIVEDLARQARDRLRRLGYTNVTVRAGDGHAGWPEHAPFDAIIVTAAGLEIPPPLMEQLKPGGRMLIPVGERYEAQELVLVIKADDGAVTTRNVLPVAFVPLTENRR